MKKLFALLLLLTVLFSLASCATAADIGTDSNAAKLLEFNFYETVHVKKPAELEAPAGVTDIVTASKGEDKITVYYCESTAVAEELLSEMENTLPEGCESKIIGEDKLFIGTPKALFSASALGVDLAEGAAEMLKFDGYNAEHIKSLPEGISAHRGILEIIMASKDSEKINIYFCEDETSAHELFGELEIVATRAGENCILSGNKLYVGTESALEYATNSELGTAKDTARILGYNEYKLSHVSKPADLIVPTGVGSIVTGQNGDDAIIIFYCDTASDAKTIFDSLSASAAENGLECGISAKKVYIGTANAISCATGKLWHNQLYHTFIDDNNYNYVFSGLGNTLIITLGSLLIGVFLGVLIAVAKYYSDGNPKLKAVSMLCDLYTTVIRGIPITVLLLIFFFVILVSADGVLVAIIAFGINSGAYMAELVRGGINAVDRGQMEAARSLGMSKWQAMRTIIFPQAVKNILPAIGNECIALLKETSVAGYVAVVDLTRGVNLIRNNTYDAFNPLILSALIYLGLVILMTKLLSILERRLAKSGKR